MCTDLEIKEEHHVHVEGVETRSSKSIMYLCSCTWACSRLHIYTVCYKEMHILYHVHDGRQSLKNTVSCIQEYRKEEKLTTCPNYNCTSHILASTHDLNFCRLKRN
jgi:hypothetical protein